jgi:DNA recombination protein RmuC
VLPIDSKWAATSLLEQFATTQDLPGRARLKSEIERSVLEKAREIRRYLDPDLTPGFGVAVVPDSVYDLCAGIHAEAFRLRVVLVSYSMFVPYLLLVFQTTLRAGNDIDLKKLDAHLRTAQESVTLLQEELEGRFARSLTMLGNARADMGLHLSKVSSALTSLQLTTPRQPGETPALPVIEPEALPAQIR